MSISNVFREPRRELTEQLVGAAVVGVLLLFDWRFALWFQASVNPADKEFRIVGLIVGLGCLALLSGLTVFTHFIGEQVCDSLQRRGLHLRPRVRQ